jgi:hypothetical protein
VTAFAIVGSVEALQVRLIADEEIAVAERFAGTVGAVVSRRVITTLAFLEVETFPAPSFTHPYRVFAPADVKVNDEGATDVQPEAEASGATDEVVAMYPATPDVTCPPTVGSVAVKEVIDTVREDDVEGMVKVETVGIVVSTPVTHEMVTFTFPEIVPEPFVTEQV